MVMPGLLQFIICNSSHLTKNVLYKKKKNWTFLQRSINLNQSKDLKFIHITYLMSAVRYSGPPVFAGVKD